MPRLRSRSRSSEHKYKPRVTTRRRDSEVSNRRSESSESPGPSVRRTSRDYSRTKHTTQRTGGEGADLANAGAQMQRNYPCSLTDSFVSGSLNGRMLIRRSDFEPAIR
jgi:hypothetical protein